MPSVAVLSCFVVLYLTLLSFPVEAVDDANDDQYAFLTDLYKSTSGEMWKNNTNWLVRDDDKGISLCNWYGVSCSGKWVDGLDLSSNALGGPLPDKWERLPYLNSLDLSSNKVLGTIPPSIGNLTLTNLYLDKNSLSGTIPDTLSNFRSLHTLDLSSNRLTGTIPACLGNLTLENLFLAHNSLIGTIPDTLGDLNARLIYVDDNKLTGTLPASLARNPLQGITLDLNHLTGTVPSSFGNIGAQLMVISASFNDFSGSLPRGLCDANSCNFQYNTHLGCPSDACSKCMVPSCNCGKVCYSASDCAGGSCPGCSKGPWGYTTCGGR